MLQSLRTYEPRTKKLRQRNNATHCKRLGAEQALSHDRPSILVCSSFCSALDAATCYAVAKCCQVSASAQAITASFYSLGAMPSTETGVAENDTGTSPSPATAQAADTTYIRQGDTGMLSGDDNDHAPLITEVNGRPRRTRPAPLPTLSNAPLHTFMIATMSRITSWPSIGPDRASFPSCRIRRPGPSSWACPQPGTGHLLVAGLV